MKRNYRTDTGSREDQIETWFERQIDQLDAQLMRGEIGQPAYDIEFTRLADDVETRLANA